MEASARCPLLLILIGSSCKVSNLIELPRCCHGFAVSSARDGTMQTYADKESASRTPIEAPTRCHLTLTLLREVSNDD